MVKQEFDSDTHRLVSEDGTRFTEWADYSWFTYLDGMVGITRYFLSKSVGEFKTILTPEEFCKLAGIGPKDTN